MKTGISAILLDLDETILYDHVANEAAFAATAARAREIAGIDPNALRDAVRESARTLWQEGPNPDWCHQIGTSEVEGLRSRFAGDDPHMAAMRTWGPEFRRKSWVQALRRCGHEEEILAEELDAWFEQERAATNPFIPGAAAALDDLANRFRLAIVTNGLPDVQREKLARTGLMDRFEAVVISAELGVGKPDRRMFDEALRQMSLDAGECLMVGDNIRRDVGGAQDAGIRAAWISDGRPLPDGAITPFLEIISLAELPGVI